MVIYGVNIPFQDDLHSFLIQDNDGVELDGCRNCHAQNVWYHTCVSPMTAVLVTQCLGRQLRGTMRVCLADDSRFYPQCLCRLGRLRDCLSDRYKAVRHMAARCLAAAARLELHTTMVSVVCHVLPLLGERLQTGLSSAQVDSPAIGSVD